jgi:hypothetical protein
LLRERERLLAVMRGPDVVSHDAQQHRETVGGILVVVDDEHLAFSDLRGGRRRARDRGPKRFRCGRQPHGEFAARAGAGAVGGNRAAMQAHQLVHQREPHAETALVTLRRFSSLRKHLEDPRQHLGLDPHAGVVHANHREFPLARGRQ